MRARRALLTLLTLSACGGSNDGGFASTGGGSSESSASTQGAETGTPTTTATGGPPTTTAETDGEGTGVASVASTGDHGESTGAVDTSTGAVDTSTGTIETGAVDTSTGTVDSGESTGTPDTGESTGCVSGSDTTTGGESSGGESSGGGCPEGQDGCPCAPGNICDAGLACMAGMCGPAPKCGDGKIDPGETCDDGANNGNTAACKANCTKQACGDGFMGPGEQCDDGNQVDGDGCQKTCVKTPMQTKDACGFDTDGVWFQIDYSNAFTVSNPSYTYSPTPGWGEAQWAPTGKGWPYAVDLFNNAKVVNDQIGTVALLDGTNKAVRVYFGIAGLSYTYATVCVEGRSYSVGSSVTFFVEEAKTKCGDYGMMANDWTVHATGVDMADCFIQGDEFQAVQVQPSSGSGSLSLKRLRVTLHGASY